MGQDNYSKLFEGENNGYNIGHERRFICEMLILGKNVQTKNL